MGYNTLLLDVFYNGQTYFPNNMIAPETKEASGVLDAAVKEAAIKHIALYPVMDLLLLAQR